MHLNKVLANEVSFLTWSYIGTMTSFPQPEVTSPGLSGNRSEAVDTITVTYPTVKICTTSVSPPIPPFVHTLVHNLTRNAHAHILPAPASQCVCKQSAEATRSHALLTAREARLFTNLRARTAAYE